jgi:hypothetical protein
MPSLQDPRERGPIDRPAQLLELSPSAHPPARTLRRVAVVARDTTHSPAGEQPGTTVYDTAVEIVNHGPGDRRDRPRGGTERRHINAHLITPLRDPPVDGSVDISGDGTTPDRTQVRHRRTCKCP